MNYRARAYPYPVLSTFSDDFELSTEFEAKVEAEIVGDSNDQRIKIAFSVSQPSAWLNEFISDGNARICLDVQCRSTMYRKYVDIPDWSGSLQFEGGALYGRVQITPLIVSRITTEDYSPSGVNSEFSGNRFSIVPGDLLGIGDTTQMDFEFTRVLERDLITIQYTQDLEYANTYRFMLDSNRIIIVAGEDLRMAIEQMRADRSVRPYLFMSLYKDCIAAALQQMAQEHDIEWSQRERPWERALQRRLQAIGRDLDPENPDEQEISAQLLVASKGVEKIGVSDE